MSSQSGPADACASAGKVLSQIKRSSAEERERFWREWDESHARELEERGNLKMTPKPRKRDHVPSVGF